MLLFVNLLCNVCLTFNIRAVGNDPRKAVVDGYPIEQVIASDLHPGNASYNIVSST